MQHLTALLARLTHLVQPIAERLGAPGLAAIAFLDSSFLSLPEVADALIVVLVIQKPAEWVWIALSTTIGSVAGCYALFLVARKGGEAFLRRRLRERHLTRGLALFQRHGLLTLIVPSILPPPTPFKLFVLLAGIADVRPLTFVFAVAFGRFFRYGGEAWLARRYGSHATEFIRDNLPIVSVWLAVVVVVIGVGVAIWRRRRPT
jgi:membrane protein YqaA with SNARE-associated domain